MFISKLHVGVIVHSLEESVKFYTELLGLSVDGIVESSGLGVKFGFLSHAGQTVELLEYTDERAGQKRLWGPVDHIGFTFDTIEPIVQRLRQASVRLHSDEIRRDPSDDSRFIFFDGPNGERLELFQEGQPTPQK